ncbi:E3 ubiquitin-protein ligase bre1 [Tulasnella sp. 418]|nr:E3 ubiquitin-protein ligase bre1 [Tulasnella sp. 418]
MMEVRKRPISPDNSGGPAAKRRIISASSESSKVLNGVGNHDDEEKEIDVAGDELERFRKEAIFRRMKHYSRQYERSASRIAELEEKSLLSDAAVAAVEACWKQLIAEIHTLLPSGLPGFDQSSTDIYRITHSLTPDSMGSQEITPKLYYDALSETSKSTQNLIASFIQLAPKASEPSTQQLQNRCRQSESRSVALQSEVNLLRSELLSAREEIEKMKEKLDIAENNVERVRSETVVVLEAKLGKSLKNGLDSNPPGMEVESHATPPQANGIPHRVSSSDGPDYSVIAESREHEIQALVQEKVALEREIVQLKSELAFPSEKTLMETIQYKLLHSHLVDLKSAAEEARERYNKVFEEVQQLKVSRQEFEAKCKSEAKMKIEELNNQIHRLHNDLTRVRAARDLLVSEAQERKSRDEKTAASTQLLRELNKTSADRIAVLTSEIKRLKSRLAATSGEEDLYAFLSGNSDENMSYVKQLRAKLSEAENRIRVLEDTQKAFSEANPDLQKYIHSEMEARQQYTKARELLDKYERTYGSTSGSNLPVESQHLARLLSAKDEELRIMALKQKEEAAASDIIYGELDKISAALTRTEEKANEKLASLTSLEQRIETLKEEKTRMESKYYASVKAKEASELERKALTRNMEKQAKVMERLQEADEALKSQLLLQEKELALTRHNVQKQRERLSELERSCQVLQFQKEGEEKRAEQHRADYLEARAFMDKKREEMRRMEEENTRFKRDAERTAQIMNQAPSGSATHRELQLKADNENLLKLLRCSTCAKEFRTHTLTKCMHTFCKSCIDARLTTRQRKCPACNAGFAQSDVQALYFQ